MSLAAVAECEARKATGGTQIVEADLRSALISASIQDGFLAVEVPAPGPASRGRLNLLLESSIEEALHQHEGAPAGVEASTDLDSSLSDQLYRARQVGYVGLALWLPPLAGIANLAGTLDAEDSAVLRWWIRETGERPLRVLIDDKNRRLGVYGLPIQLQLLVEGGSDADPVTEDPRCRPTTAAATIAGPSANVTGQAPADREPDSGQAAHCQGPCVEQLDLDLDPFGHTQPPAPFASTPEAEQADGDPAQDEDAAPDGQAPLRRAPVPLHANAEKDWRSWMGELDRARGPKPLAAVERLFVTRYVPLSDAVQCGIADHTAEHVLHRWADAFSRSYLDAFDALRLRGSRPTMVLDVPDIALRISRLHGARSIQLLVVDGMRFDVGLRVHEYIRSLLGQSAALTERLLLWAALPSTTSVQLELLRRGPRGLREFCSEEVTELPVARGRSATTLRRLKSGHRELLKLDVVEARLTEPNGSLVRQLDAVALEAAEALATHFLNLPARTLVVVFGDHGFRVETHPDGGWSTAQGGATPEEVLVPAYAWLVGSVH